MSLCAEELKNFVIIDTLQYLDLNLSENDFKALTTLLLGTAALESGLGIQMRSGKRLGLYQISPALHKSIWDKFLVKEPSLASQVRGLAGQHSFLKNPHAELISNLRYATAIALMVYLRAEQALPKHNDLTALANFWQRHFNRKSRHNVGDFIKSFQRLFPTKLAAA